MLCWLCVCSHGSVVLRLTELSALQEYKEDVREFKLKVDDTDRRLGAVFCQAFEDASGLEHAFKVWEQDLSVFLSLTFTETFSHVLKALSLIWCLQVLDMFGSLLQRPLVAADAQDRYPLLVSMMDRELDCCKLLFNKHIQTAEELGESRSNADSLHNAIVIYLTERCMGEQYN